VRSAHGPTLAPSPGPATFAHETLWPSAHCTPRPAPNSRAVVSRRVSAALVGKSHDRKCTSRTPGSGESQRHSQPCTPKLTKFQGSALMVVHALSTPRPGQRRPEWTTLEGGWPGLAGAGSADWGKGRWPRASGTVGGGRRRAISPAGSRAPGGSGGTSGPAPGLRSAYEPGERSGQLGSQGPQGGPGQRCAIDPEQAH
jgi:hypothetical protein